MYPLLHGIYASHYDALKPDNIQEFTANGTWTKPSGFHAGATVFVEVWGGGGAGGSNSGIGGGGGGGGGKGEYRALLSTLGATESVTVGPGGPVSGLPGSNSSFGIFKTAGGGDPGTDTNGGGGGSGDFPGQDGFNQATDGGSGGNAGGDGGGAGGAGGIEGGAPPHTGDPPGGGGGGAADDGTDGAAGGNGFVRVTIRDAYRAYLPSVGPFATNGTVSIGTLDDIHFATGGTCSYTENRATPLTYKDVTFDGGSPLAPNHTDTNAIFIWADRIIFNTGVETILTDGGAGGPGLDENVTGFVLGTGGSAGFLYVGVGSSGGGAGGQGQEASPSDGGAGGSGGNGDRPPQIYWDIPQSTGGVGTGTNDSTGYAFYGSGGAGGNGGTVNGTPGFGGAGGNGFGGGGGGGDATGSGSGIGAGGGGGSGGLLVCIANEIRGVTTVSAMGADGGQGMPGAAGGGGAGGGVVWFAARKYDGQTTPVVTGGAGYISDERAATQSSIDLSTTDLGWTITLTSIATGFSTNLINFSVDTNPLNYSQSGNDINVSYTGTDTLDDIVNLINANSTLVTASGSGGTQAEGTAGPYFLTGGFPHIVPTAGANGSPGLARIFRINRNDTLTEMTWTSSWNLL